MSAFSPTSIVCIIHAIALLMAALFCDVATIFDFGVWFWCVLVWPLWYMIVPMASRRYKWRSVAPLALGTIIWIYPGFLAGALILLSGSHGC